MDNGCEEDRSTPICWNPDNKNDGSGAEGKTCIECLKDAHCPEDKPLCDLTKHVCVVKPQECPSNKPYWNDKLAACQDGKGTADVCCTVCYDSTAKDDERDVGCEQVKGIGVNLCVVPSNPVNDGKGTNGTKCTVCYDDATGAKKDMGCGGNTWKGKNICLTSGNKNDGKKTLGDSCVECLVNADCPSNKPYCDDHVCKTCETVSKAKKQDPLRRYYVKNETQDGCYVCVDNQKGRGVDLGCGGEKPVCVDSRKSDKYLKGGTNLGINGECYRACEGDDYCLNEKGECIKLDDYYDLYRDGKGYCRCYSEIVSKTVKDMGHTYPTEMGYSWNCKNDNDNWDTGKKRLNTQRARIYTVPTKPRNFYCPYWFEARGEADDYVDSDNSDGIGVPHASWSERHNNSLKDPKTGNWHRRAKTLVQGNKQQKKVVVRDRWACEVGYDGYFKFVLDEEKAKKQGIKYGSKKKEGINVDIDWGKKGKKGNPTWADKK
jgi:hypothetical protein